MKDVLSHIHSAMAEEEVGEFKFDEGAAAFFGEENGAEAPLDANLSNLG